MPTRKAAAHVEKVQKHLETLKAIADEYADPPDSPPLTTPQIRLVRSTPLEGLLAAANFAEAVPGVGGVLSDATLLKEAIDFELAHMPLLAAARELVIRIETRMLRQRLEAVLFARGLYRVGKSYVTTGSTQHEKVFVQAMRRTLGRHKRRKPAGGDAEE